jgi:hypothetical protein
VTFDITNITILYVINYNGSARDCQAEFVIGVNIAFLAPHHTLAELIIIASKEQGVGQLFSMLQGYECVVHSSTPFSLSNRY